MIKKEHGSWYTHLIRVFVRVFWRYLWSWRYYMVQSSGAPPSLWSMTANSQGQPGSPMMQHWLLWHLRKVQKFTKYKILMQTFTANLTFKESSDATTSQCKPHLRCFSHILNHFCFFRGRCVSACYIFEDEKLRTRWEIIRRGKQTIPDPDFRSTSSAVVDFVARHSDHCRKNVQTGNERSKDRKDTTERFLFFVSQPILVQKWL